jgi:hypothetical protein
MAEKILVFNAKNAAADTIQTFYPAEVDTQILTFTASNDSAASVSYKAYVYGETGTPDAVVPQKIVVKDRFDLGASIVGKLIPAGGSLRMETSDADALLFNVTGEEIT